MSVSDIVLLVAVVTAVAWSRLVEDVCSMPQWDAALSTITGRYKDGSPSIDRINLRVSYDYNNSRLAVYGPLFRQGVYYYIQEIWNYETAIHYSVVNFNNCTKTAISGTFKKACVPRAADYSWDKTHYGIDDSARLLIWEYKGRQDDLDYYIHTTYIGNPVMVQTYGDVNGGSVFSHTSYLNMTPGVLMPSVFTPPSSCDSGGIHHDANSSWIEDIFDNVILSP